MKRRWLILAGILALGALGIWLLRGSSGSEARALEATRRALRKEGYKTDLTDFDFSTSPEIRVRAVALTRGEFSRTPRGESLYGWSSLNQAEHPDLMTSVGSDAALVIWRQEQLPLYPGSYPMIPQAPGRWPEHQIGTDAWPALRAMLSENRADLDQACTAALSGPIRFNLEASHGNAMLLPHLAAVTTLARVLATRTMVELRDNHREAAWTNLLAATRLVTAWQTEPVEISQMVRCGCMTTAYNLTWQALQTDGWGEARLAALQREWEAVEFLRRLPEAAAFSGASMVATCRAERQEPLPVPTSLLKDVMGNPQGAWYRLLGSGRRLHYRHHGTYEDERDLMLFYRDRELQLRHAVQSANWVEMRQLPGVTNTVHFSSKHSSRMQSLYNMRQLALASVNYRMGGNSPAGRAAEAEVRRRLMVTAIALERYRGRHGSYPASLQALAPELLSSPPIDFMDGRPLRYRLTGDGHFVLYSVGLDCVDNGGKMPFPRSPRDVLAIGRPGRLIANEDVVWPRPGSKEEAGRLHQEEMNAFAAQTEDSEARDAEAHWERTAKRQARAESILLAPPPATNDLACQGRPFSEVLRNPAVSGTNHLTPTDMLALKQVTTGAEPEIVTFELLVNYDVMTNVGSLGLYVDPSDVEDEYSDEGFQAAASDCKRAANGNCLLVWNTIYETPGKHAVMAGFTLGESARTNDFANGPVVPFVVSNLCQFSLASASFQPETGVNLRARLAESNGTFRIEIKAPGGAAVKTINGSTSNGVLKAHWDLIDDHGRRCTNNAYDTVFQITLPASGRSQTLKGP